MKRIISLLSCLVIVVLCFVVPVSADSELGGSPLLNLLDYGNAIENNDNTLEFKNTGVLNYRLPDEMIVSYVDVVFNFWGSGGGPSPETISIIRNGSSVWSTLKIAKISTYLYRAYGSFSQKAFRTIGFQVKTNKPDEECQFTIEQFHIGAFNVTNEFTDSYVEVHVNGKTNLVHHNDASNAFFSWEVVGDNSEGDFSADLYCYNNWMQYDYIDYTFGCMVADITSINVTSNGSSVPFEVSLVESTTNPSSAFFITVRVDQTNVDRTLVGYCPRVQVWGNSHFTDLNAITVSSVVGHVKYEKENPVIYWFKKTYASVVDGFQSVVNAITGSNSDMDQTGQDMKDAADDLNEEAAAFDQIYLPDIDVEGLTQQFVNFSPSGLTVLATITTNPYVSGLLILVFTFALCAYVLFGKR